MKVRARAIFSLLAALFCLGLAAAPSLAAPSQKDKATARASYAKGKKLVMQKKLDDAIEAFREADRLDPKPQYKLDLARALIETSSLVEASAILAEAKESKAPADRQVVQAAQQTETKLAQRIPTLTVTVKGPDPSLVKLTIDRKDATLGEPTKLDPGQYEVRAEANGYTAQQKTVVLKEGEKKDLPLSLAPDPTMAKKEGEEGEKEEADEGGGGTMVPAVIAFGVGGVGVALGTVFGIVAFSQTSAVEEACGGKVCPTSLADDVNAAVTYGNVSTAMFVVGAAGVGAGIVLALTVGSGGGDEPEKKNEARVEPYFDGTGVGVVGRF